MTRLEWLLCISLVVVFITASLFDQFWYGWQEDIFPLQYIVTIIIGWGWIENFKRKQIGR